MGGTGSGRWTYHERRRTVEGCWSISISQVARIIDLRDPQSVPRGLRPTLPKSGTRMSPLRCVLQIGENGTLALILSYAVKDRWGLEVRVEEAIQLQTTKPNFGGLRWWFSCPRKVDGGRCGRRVGKLYRLPDHRRFACRHCLDLTYESCQRSHRYDGILAHMAGEGSGEMFEAVKRAISHKTKEGRRQRAAPTPRLLDAFERTFLPTDKVISARR